MNPSKLLRHSPHDHPSPIDLSLSQSSSLLHSRLKPPFSLQIPTPSEYKNLNLAIAYGVLTNPPHIAKTHLVHLHGIVTDGYALFTATLIDISHHLYPKLLDLPRSQILWVLPLLIDAAASGIERLVVSLLRRINGGDFSEPNLWLSAELLRVLFEKWDWVLEEPTVITSALFVYLRLLADHYRLAVDRRLDALKRMEVDFCLRVLRQKFGLCLRIGRDLVRLLQDVVFIPEFGDLWKDLLFNPSAFGVPDYSDIAQIYRTRTPSQYFLLTITAEMETWMRFLLTHVKLGCQRRYQEWFARKFLYRPEQETVIVDLIRFMCCAHHPPNEIIQSDVTQRWAVIGWLLKCCRKNYFEANAKLALFYDWLFFNEREDSIMNIEPAILLMVHSVPKYVELSNKLMEFLFLLVDNYDVSRKDMLAEGVSAAFGLLVQKGVVNSLEPLSSCQMISPLLRDRLTSFLSNSRMETVEEPLLLSKPEVVKDPSVSRIKSLVKDPSVSSTSDTVKGQPAMRIMEAVTEPSVSRKLEAPKESPTLTKVVAVKEVHAGRKLEAVKEPALNKSEPLKEPSTICTAIVESRELKQSMGHARCGFGRVKDLVKNLGSAVKQTKESGLRALENLLISITEVDFQALENGPGENLSMTLPELASQITEAFKSVGYGMFIPLKALQNEKDFDDEVHSATAVILQAYIFYPHEQMRNMLLFWCKNGHPVGARLLSYASRLAFETQKLRKNHIVKERYSKETLLPYHIAGYITSKSSSGKCSYGDFSVETVDFQLMAGLVDGAFTAYRDFIKSSVRDPILQHVGTQVGVCLEKVSCKGPIGLDQDPSMFLLSDLLTCSGWNLTRSSELFHSIFCHLSDLSTSKREFIQLLVEMLDHVDLVAMQFEISLKRFCIFGEESNDICKLVKSSLSWDLMNQKKLWGLLVSEVLVSNVKVEEIFLKLCSNCIDPAVNSIAMEGLFTLTRYFAPTLELIGAVMTLPNNLGDFAAAVLSSWASCNSLIFVTSFAEWLQKFNEKGGMFSSSKVVVKLNISTVGRLLEFFDNQSVNGMSLLPISIPEIKMKLLHLITEEDGR